MTIQIENLHPDPITYIHISEQTLLKGVGSTDGNVSVTAEELSTSTIIVVSLFDKLSWDLIHPRKHAQKRKCRFVLSLYSDNPHSHSVTNPAQVRGCNVDDELAVHSVYKKKSDNVALRNPIFSYST